MPFLINIGPTHVLAQEHNGKMQFEAKIMSNHSINELCRAVAQLSLPEYLGGAEAEAAAVNRDNLSISQNKLSQTLLHLVKAHRRSSQFQRHIAESKPDSDTTVDDHPTGMLTCP